MAYLSLPILIMDINGFMFWSPPIIFALLISCDWCHTTSYNLPLLTKPHLWQIGSPYLTTFPWFWPWVGLPYLSSWTSLPILGLPLHLNWLTLLVLKLAYLSSFGLACLCLAYHTLSKLAYQFMAYHCSH